MIFDLLATFTLSASDIFVSVRRNLMIHDPLTAGSAHVRRMRSAKRTVYHALQ